MNILKGRVRNGRNLTTQSCWPAARGGSWRLAWETDSRGGLTEVRTAAVCLERELGRTKERAQSLPVLWSLGAKRHERERGMLLEREA